MVDFREEIHDRIYMDVTATRMEWGKVIDPDTRKEKWVKQFLPVPGRNAVLTEDGAKILMDVLDSHINKITPMTTLTRNDSIRNTVELDWAVSKAIGADLDEFLTNEDMILQFDAILDTTMVLVFNFNMLAEKGAFREWSKQILSIQYSKDSEGMEESKGLLGGFKQMLSRQHGDDSNRR